MLVKVGTSDAGLRTGTDSSNVKGVVPPPSGGGGAWTPNPANVTMLGDYSTNDFSQWGGVQMKGYNSSGSGYTAGIRTYSLGLYDDATLGKKAARYEVRNGDNPGFSPGTERAEVSGQGQATGGTSGQTRWYEFRTKFDATFPAVTQGFGTTNQWHGTGSTGSPPFGFYLEQAAGKWSLTIQKQSAPGTYISVYVIWDVSLGTAWHHIIMRVVFSSSDTTGSIQLWYNGVRQTFKDSTQTHFVRTLIPGDPSVYYKEGLYRETSTPQTGIVYHQGFRCCDDPAGLTIDIS